VVECRAQYRRGPETTARCPAHQAMKNCPPDRFWRFALVPLRRSSCRMAVLDWRPAVAVSLQAVRRDDRDLSTRYFGINSLTSSPALAASMLRTHECAKGNLPSPHGSSNGVRLAVSVRSTAFLQGHLRRVRGIGWTPFPPCHRGLVGSPSYAPAAPGGTGGHVQERAAPAFIPDAGPSCILSPGRSTAEKVLPKEKSTPADRGGGRSGRPALSTEVSAHVGVRRDRL